MTRVRAEAVKNTKNVAVLISDGKYLNAVLAVISGLLAFLSFPPSGYSFLAWIAFIPFFFFIRRTDLRGAFFCAYLAGIVFFGTLLYWLVNVSFLGTVLLILYLAVYFGIFGVVAFLVSKYSVEILFLPFAWVAVEYLRGHVFSGFPWGFIGYSQYKNTQLIQIADVTGVYGISFLIVLVNVTIFFLLTNKNKKRISGVVITVFFVMVAIMYGGNKIKSLQDWRECKISVAQANIPQSLKWDAKYADTIIREYIALTESAASDKPDIMIWPETAYPYLVDGEGDAEEIRNTAARFKIPILSGVVYQQKDHFYNAAIMFTPDGKSETKYFKMHLVPFGEYIPFAEHLAFVQNYIDKPIGDFKGGREFTLFPVRSFSTATAPNGAITRVSNFFKVGALICFEDVFPEISRDFAVKGADILVNITNDGWFGRTAASEQHLQSSVFRAVENRVPVVRAANTGVSCFIDVTGEIRSRVADGDNTFVKGHMTDIVRVVPGRSAYTQRGDIFAYFCMLVTGIVLIASIFVASGKLKFLVKPPAK
ncbi:MAG TPA: apolipoprotein N-acyltransferase [Candidatus Omnitrophota bacterium]|nr:apolipoprotein N-acyltransferase [Candidatus Omnitrophota bacterium]